MAVRSDRCNIQLTCYGTTDWGLNIPVDWARSLKPGEAYCAQSGQARSAEGEDAVYSAFGTEPPLDEWRLVRSSSTDGYGDWMEGGGVDTRE